MLGADNLGFVGNTGTVDVGKLVAGLEGFVGVTTSVPNWANGFGRPWVPSGASTIVESCRLAKAGSEKILSSNFILLTLSRSARKFWAIEEFAVAPEVAVADEVLVPTGAEDTKVGGVEEDLVKKRYPSTSKMAITTNIIMFLIFGISNFLTNKS